jgi:hypothetical protein
VSVNYHTLSDFRTAHPQVLDDLLTHSVAALMHEGLVSLHRVAQDGMRVRAHAGASSFRRRVTLEECRSQAQEQVESLRQELEENPGASNRRQHHLKACLAVPQLDSDSLALEVLYFSSGTICLFVVSLSHHAVSLTGVTFVIFTNISYPDCMSFFN